jgi:hypothetical protein
MREILTRRTSSVRTQLRQSGAEYRLMLQAHPHSKLFGEDHKKFLRLRREYNPDRLLVAMDAIRQARARIEFMLPLLRTTGVDCPCCDFKVRENIAEYSMWKQIKDLPKKLDNIVRQLDELHSQAQAQAIDDGQKQEQNDHVNDLLNKESE